MKYAKIDPNLNETLQKVFKNIESSANGTSTITKSFDGDEQYGFVISKDNKDLTAAINASLKKLKENGKYDEILKKYLGESQ